jgi:hypothetical protein
MSIRRAYPAFEVVYTWNICLYIMNYINQIVKEFYIIIIFNASCSTCSSLGFGFLFDCKIF